MANGQQEQIQSTGGGFQPANIGQRFLERAVKRIEKNIDSGVDRKLQMQSPIQVLGELMQSLGVNFDPQENFAENFMTLAKAPTQGTGQRMGLFQSLAAGRGFDRPETGKALGLKGTRELFELIQRQQTVPFEQQKSQADAQKAWLEANKMKLTRYRINTETKQLEELEHPMIVPFDYPTPEYDPEEERQLIESEQRAREEEQRELQIFEEKEKIKSVQAAKKDFRIYMSDAGQMATALEKIETASKNLPVFERGFWQQLTSKGKVKIGEMGAKKEITRYLGVVAQELIPAARKIMEEKGPITEFDVDRVEQGLGMPSVPLADKIFLINQLKSKVRKQIELKAKLAGISVEKVRKVHSKLFKVLEDTPEVAEKKPEPIAKGIPSVTKTVAGLTKGVFDGVL